MDEVRSKPESLGRVQKRQVCICCCGEAASRECGRTEEDCGGDLTYSKILGVFLPMCLHEIGDPSVICGFYKTSFCA